MPVFAHVTLDNQQAIAGSYYKAILKITHGCDGSPTKRVVVDIPEGFKGAKPMVKPSWEINIQKEKLVKPYVSHGKTIHEDVTRIEWSGGLIPAAYYDEFVLVGQLSETPGNLYWKVTQICDTGKMEWVEIPASGKSMKDYKFPAAVLKVLPVQNDHDQHKH